MHALIEAFLKELREWRESLTKSLIAGATDYPEYRELIGKIQTVTQAEQKFTDLVKPVLEDETENL